MTSDASKDTTTTTVKADDEETQKTPETVESETADLERTKQENEWRIELSKLDYEIATLRSVLRAKIQESNELKRKLGITPVTEIKEDFKEGIKAITESTPYQKTNTALKNFGSFASRKLGDIRNSNAFRSVENKVGGAYSSVKMRVSSSQSQGNMEEALQDMEESTVTTDEVAKEAQEKPASDDSALH